MGQSENIQNTQIQLNYYLLYLILGPSINMCADRTLPQLPKLQISES